MKKILLFLTSFLPLAAAAQLNGDGYYRIQNNASERYVTLKDNVVNGEVDMSSATADVSNLRSWRGFDQVEANPASIFYIKNMGGNQYNLIAQGTSVYDITGGKKYIDIYDKASGSYYLFEVTSGGVAGHIYDSNDSAVRGSITTKGEKAYMYWRLLPVTTDNNYIGLKPTVQAADGWYGTVYASFPFKLNSSNVTVYYVDGVHAGQFQLKQVESEIIPAATPLVFKTDSNDPAQNKIIPVAETTSVPTDNLLSGTYFSSRNRNHEAYVEFDASKMRVLGVDADKNLVLTSDATGRLTEKGDIPMNTCWLNVPEGLSGDFKLVDRGTYTAISNIETSLPKTAKKGTYTLTGVQVDDTKALRPGIYIQNGKKIIIK
jgi:hypothetical protein